MQTLFQAIKAWHLNFELFFFFLLKFNFVIRIHFHIMFLV